MNTEASQDQTVPETTGVRLRQAREALGLTQQMVAERLCLKVSTIRDIEEDKAQANLASTFHRGYIRSYAKLVHLPEDELLPMLAKQAPIRAAKVAPMQSFSLGKKHKKRDGWLMTFTWLIAVEADHGSGCGGSNDEAPWNDSPRSVGAHELPACSMEGN